MKQLQKPQLKSRIPAGVRSAGGSGLGSLIFLLVLIFGGAALYYQNFQNISDWYQLRHYDAPAVIKQFADQDTMTPYGRKVFYVAHPSLDEKQAFSQNCPDATREQTIVLGCYRGNESGIFLLKVDDTRLNGVEQVTAAHEMLHAAYDRLSSDKKTEVNAMLQDYYDNHLTDERIKKTIDAYRKSEPNDVVNEMHSIFATEVVDLPSGLESYYTKYFSSRKTVAEMSVRYQAEFTSRQDAVKSYDDQLASLKTQIDTAKSNIDADQKDIDSQKANLEQLKRSGNTSEYNAGVPGYNSAVDNYNDEVRNTKSLIARYNDLVETRNSVALQQDQLVEELKGNSAAVKN